jgi:hypothetical protein
MDCQCKQLDAGAESEDQRCRRMYHELKARAKDTWKRYQEAGIADSVYHDSMSDIAVWAEDYHRKHGHYGIKEVAWIEKSLAMKVFKLGRLQFERLEDEAAATLVRQVHTGDGTLVLNTHIQAGTALDEAACEASYQAAAPFYAERGFVFKQILFVCDSWLLNPLLRDLLPEDSNIIRFQRKYAILSQDNASRQMEERVFGSRKDDPAEYPEDTTLKRKLKAALIQGRTAGTCKGFFILKTTPGQSSGRSVNAPALDKCCP